MADLSNAIAAVTEPLPPKNHNNPPGDIEILGETLILKHVHVVRNAEAHIEMAANIPDHFTAENEAVFVTDFIKLMQNAMKELERRREQEKEPFLRQGQYVDKFFNDLKKGLENSIIRAKKPLDDWVKRKADAEKTAREADAKLLIEQQQAALRAAIAHQPATTTAEAAVTLQAAIQRVVEATEQVKVAQAIAAAPITSMARTTGTKSTAGLQTKWVGMITDIDQLELSKLRPYISHKELQAALDRYVKQGGRNLEGAEIKEVIETKVK